MLGLHCFLFSFSCWSSNGLPLKSVSMIPSVRCNTFSLTTLVHCCHCVVCSLLKRHTDKPCFFSFESSGPSILWVLVNQAPIWLDRSSNSLCIMWTNWRSVALYMKFKKIILKTHFYSCFFLPSGIISLPGQITRLQP